jgi:hypothetical protein
MSVHAPLLGGVPHGLYQEDGRRINEWKGKIVINPDTGNPQLDPPLRLLPGETVYAWFEGCLVATFTDEGQYKPFEVAS